MHRTHRAIRRPVLLLVLLFEPSFAGCASYWKARGRDACDIVTLGTETGSWGFSAHAGPWAIGLGNWNLAMSGSMAAGCGLIGGQLTTYACRDCGYIFGVFQKLRELADDSRRKEYYVGSLFPYPLILPQPAGAVSGGGKEVEFEEAGDWRRWTPRYTQVEATCGIWLFGFRAGVNPGEALDFILGWIGIDLYGDDSPEGPPKSSKEEKPPAATMEEPDLFERAIDTPKER